MCSQEEVQGIEHGGLQCFWYPLLAEVSSCCSTTLYIPAAVLMHLQNIGREKRIKRTKDF